MFGMGFTQYQWVFSIIIASTRNKLRWPNESIYWWWYKNLIYVVWITFHLLTKCIAVKHVRNDSIWPQSVCIYYCVSLSWTLEINSTPIILSEWSFFLNIYVEHFWKLPPGPSRHDRPDIVSHISSLFITYVNKENYTGKFETNLLQRIRKCIEKELH